VCVCVWCAGGVLLPVAYLLPIASCQLPVGPMPMDLHAAAEAKRESVRLLSVPILIHTPAFTSLEST
jgi:hypothetical protein